MTEPFYAVRVGRAPGVYRSWPECFDQINGFPKAAFKKFRTLPEAEDFLRGKDTNRKPGFYAVRNGRVPGIYLTWAECQSQITNYPKPAFKKFRSIEEAQQFVNGIDPSRMAVDQATTSYFPGLYPAPAVQAGFPNPATLTVFIRTPTTSADTMDWSASGHKPGSHIRHITYGVISQRFFVESHMRDLWKIGRKNT